MKNIHVLPTDKPSRLYIRTDVTPHFYSNFQGKPYNIYITSDEEIKEGDWVLNTNTNSIAKYTGHGSMDWWVKIILTTDQDLIKDGVQAIDDEFLEWFVSKANDSGKPIDIVEVEEVYFHGSGYYDANQLSEQEKELYSYLKEYKILILKEEPKQETLEELTSEYHSIAYGKLIKELTKQETLEEASERMEILQKIDCDKMQLYFDGGSYSLGFNNGAKWQQEQDNKVYSEEEVLKYVDYYEECYAERPTKKPLKPDEWFEQKFKNK